MRRFLKALAVTVLADMIVTDAGLALEDARILAEGIMGRFVTG